MSPSGILGAGAAAAALLAALPALAGTPGAEELLPLVNAERQAQDAPPVRLSKPLSAAAQTAADEEARGEDSGKPGLLDRARAAGYEAQLLSQVIASTGGDAEFLMSSWRERGGSTYADLTRQDFRDIGIGVARRGQTTVAVFLLGLSSADFFEEKLRPLADRERVRREMLERTNSERRRTGRAPLRPDPLLHRVAQRYAEEMLAKGFYGHTSPRGATVRERVREVGYRARAVSENLARGHFSVHQVMDGWMASEIHRRNILSPQFVDAGFGLAAGKTAEGYQVIWVQVFARRRSGYVASRLAPPRPWPFPG